MSNDAEKDFAKSKDVKQAIKLIFAPICALFTITFLIGSIVSFVLPVTKAEWKEGIETTGIITSSAFRENEKSANFCKYKIEYVDHEQNTQVANLGDYCFYPKKIGTELPITYLEDSNTIVSGWDYYKNISKVNYPVIIITLIFGFLAGYLLKSGSGRSWAEIRQYGVVKSFFRFLR